MNKIGQKKPDTKERIQYNPIYMKFKNSQNWGRPWWSSG